MKVLLAAKDLQCEEAVGLVTDYLEGALTRRQRRRLQRHLRGCRNCAAYLNQIRTTISMTGRIEPDSLPETTRDELVELYRRYRRQ